MKKEAIAGLAALFGISTGISVSEAVNNKKKTELKKSGKKLLEFYNLLIQWLTVKQNGYSLASYFEKKGYKTVAIYGMKELGERLHAELKTSGIEVKYAIDKNAASIYADIDVLFPDESMEKVDVVVVTAIHYYDEIANNISGKLDCPVISLEEIVYDCDVFAE